MRLNSKIMGMAFAGIAVAALAGATLLWPGWWAPSPAQAQPGGIRVAGMMLSEADGAGHYGLRLRSKPRSDVVVTARQRVEYLDELDGEPTRPEAGVPGELPDVGLDLAPAKVVFTRENWNRYQPVRVTARDDDVDADRVVRLTHDVMEGGTSSRMGGMTVVVAEDDDQRGVTTSKSALSLSEADANADGEVAGSYTVRLDTRPLGEVKVRPRKKGSHYVRVRPDVLTFTLADWDVPQTVRVTAFDDDMVNPVDRSVAIRHSVSGHGYYDLAVADVAVSIVDDDVAGVVLGTPAYRPFGEWSIARYELTLTSQPSPGADDERGSVKLALTLADPKAGLFLGGKTVNFRASNWNKPQVVEVLLKRSSATVNYAVSATSAEYAKVVLDATQLTAP